MKKYDWDNLGAWVVFLLFFGTLFLSLYEIDNLRTENFKLNCDKVGGQVITLNCMDFCPEESDPYCKLPNGTKIFRFDTK